MRLFIELASQKDCDARWVTKYKTNEFGYKNHASVDQKTKVITNYAVTPSSTHDSQVIKDLINKNDKSIYADSAYKSQEIEEYLKEKMSNQKLSIERIEINQLAKFNRKKIRNIQKLEYE